jgi:ABC-type branched-subunit amino acid transport system ATPase component
VSPEPILVVEDLVAGYGGQPVLRGISIRANPNEVTVIVGPNGSGKSTLMKAIVGAIKPTGGRVVLDGRDITGGEPNQLVRMGVSYVPQLDNVFPSMTVRENLEMGAYVSRSGLADRIEAMLTLFPDLRDAAGRGAGTLSGGQRNMLALARGLMSSPHLLIVDEPTAGLSPKYEGIVWEHLAMVRAGGVAVLAVEQNTRRALAHGDWAYVLVRGERRLEGTGAEFLASEDLAQLYIGGSAH